VWKARFRRSKTFGAALAVVVIVAYLDAGIRCGLYSPARSSNYLWAVYHVHSTLSDGLESPEEIAREARLAGVALVLLTDHGNPNLASSALHEEIDGVTVVGGSEAKLPDGRLTFFGARDVTRVALASFAPEAIEQARGWGAFPAVAYSEDPLYGWRYWETDFAPGGIELSNLFTCVRSLSVYDKLLLILYYPFSHYYFLKSISFPAKSFDRWDDLLQRRKTWGLVAADAHGGFHLGKSVAVHVPSYADSFSFAGLGFDRKYASRPDLAIRTGDFFNCIRGAGEPLLFDFSASHDGAKFRSGASAPRGSGLHVQVQTSNQAVRLVLRKNGNVVRRTDAGELDVPSVEAGVYRVEVYLRDHPFLSPDVPWIVSNPIFAGGAPSTSPHGAPLFSRAVQRSNRLAINEVLATAVPGRNQ
jgi:hypothetical protein